MRNPTHKFLRQKITEAIVFVLTQNNPPAEVSLEYYSDDILRHTLHNCATYFLKKGGLRKSEQETLLQLKKDINEEIDLPIIEKQLINNLTNIKPVWGEFFGTDRGEVYKTFQALKEWPCFSWHARLYYKEQRQRQLSTQVNSQYESISRHSEQMSDAGKLIQRHEKTTEQLVERSAQQFITIQQLQLELQTAKQTINELEGKLKQKESSGHLTHRMDF